MFTSILQAAPYGIEVVDSDEGRQVIVAIAKENDRIVSMIVDLCPFAMGPEQAHEFTFGVAVTSLDEGSDPLFTLDRATALPYIPPEIRPQVMDVVCHAMRALIADAANPQIVYFVTKDRNIPDYAIGRYQRLINDLEEMDYYVEIDGTDAHARRFWVMRR